jgi:hypothetical protein
MALTPVQMLIEEAGAACLMVCHLTKGGGSSPLYRAGGSIAFIAIACSGLMVLKDPTDESKRASPEWMVFNGCLLVSTTKTLLKCLLL